jgi:hypothetical protein
VLDREAQALELLAAIQERVADDASGSQLPALPPARSGRTDGAADAHHGATVRVGTPESPGIQGSGAAESR